MTLKEEKAQLNLTFCNTKCIKSLQILQNLHNHLSSKKINCNAIHFKIFSIAEFQSKQIYVKDDQSKAIGQCLAKNQI